LFALPLGFLVWLNAQAVGWDNVGAAAFVVCLGFVALTALEITAMSVFELLGSNLELRVRLRSKTRLNDLLRISAVGIFLTAASIMAGQNAFPDSACIVDFFIENNICKSCRELVDPLCARCDDRTACLQCDSGFYPIDKKCLNCKKKDPLCLECSNETCLKCEDKLFISNGKCTSCEGLQGCFPGRCDSTHGCRECQPGYYLDAG
jgi:hypothetical protein